jgi:hypothetical protein
MICGVPFKVTLCEDAFDTDLHLGQITYAKAEIKINKNATPEMQMVTLFHEMLHGMLVLCGWHEEGADEKMVQALAGAMHQSFELKSGFFRGSEAQKEETGK